MKGIWHPLVPADPGFQELMIAASKGNIEVIYGQQENPEIEERLLSNRKTFERLERAQEGGTSSG